MVLDMLDSAAKTNIYARCAFGCFLVASGSFEVGMQVMETFFQKLPDHEEHVRIGDTVETQIRQMGSPGTRPYEGYSTMMITLCVCSCTTSNVMYVVIALYLLTLTILWLSVKARIFDNSMCYLCFLHYVMYHPKIILFPLVRCILTLCLKWPSLR